MAMLFGSGEVFDADTLARLYPGGAAEYLESVHRVTRRGDRGGVPARRGPPGDPRPRRRDVPG